MTTSPHSPDDDIEAHADALAQCALEALDRRFPHKLDHLILDAGDRRLPQEIHPVFDGCYDWHSSVHMHWSLLRLRPLLRATSGDEAIRARFEARFRPELVDIELAYLLTPGRAGFERPYGWAWLLQLQQELEAQGAGATGAAGTVAAVAPLPAAGAADAARWAAALRPLADEIEQRLCKFLALSGCPVRAGTHANSAFAMLLARDYAVSSGRMALGEQIDRTALGWFGADTEYPARYEPSGTDFLSPGLCEALLMGHVLGEGFGPWWHRFMPDEAGLAQWCQPVAVTDRCDGQGVHLEGLNLSRAWCLRGLAPGVDDALSARFARAAQEHWAASWPHVTGGDFVATHWLVSFALLR
jgi:hypothetical protein